MKKNILVTGGLGYIGSHTIITLENSGYNTIIFDNLSNSDINNLYKIQEISKKELKFIQGDIRNKNEIERVFQNFDIKSIIHFAGLKSVSESIKNPLKYYENNVMGTIILLNSAIEWGIERFIFSSSATVYGPLNKIPYKEDSELIPLNPYGRTKLIVERILSDLSSSSNNINIANLRYFNPVGAHKSGLIGESPRGTPNNLMPFINDVACGKRDILNIFGSDYPTIDGTGVRDYVHVMDIADGHLAALNYLEKEQKDLVINLGTGIGHSVLQVINAYESVSGIKIPHQFVDRRNGDIAEYWADTELAESMLNWKSKKTLIEMCEDSWLWARNNIK
jgi:UDP-glucose 4-epimerase